MYVVILPARGILYCYAGKPVILKVTIVNIFTRKRKEMERKEKRGGQSIFAKKSAFWPILKASIAKIKKIYIAS